MEECSIPLGGLPSLDGLPLTRAFLPWPHSISTSDSCLGPNDLNNYPQSLAHFLLVLSTHFLSLISVALPRFRTKRNSTPRILDASNHTTSRTRQPHHIFLSDLVFSSRHTTFSYSFSVTPEASLRYTQIPLVIWGFLFCTSSRSQRVC